MLKRNKLEVFLLSFLLFLVIVHFFIDKLYLNISDMLVWFFVILLLGIAIWSRLTKTKHKSSPLLLIGLSILTIIQMISVLEKLFIRG